MPRSERYSTMFWQSSFGFYRVWVAHLGRKFGLFRALRVRHQSSEDLARSTRLDPYAVTIWCDAAVALSLISKRYGSYYITPELYRFLADEESPDYVGGQLSYLALRSLDYDAFEYFFKRRKKASFQEHLGEAFMEATKWDHTAFLKFFLSRNSKVNLLLKRGAKVIDVGCGTGEWIFRLRELFPDSFFTGIDPDNVAIEKAKTRAVHTARGKENVYFLKEKAEDMRFCKEFDIAYLGEVLCTSENPQIIVEKCFQVLKDGGLLIVSEGIKTLKNTRRAEAFLDAMNLDFALQGAKFLSKAEIEEILVESGFVNQRFMNAGGGLWFVTGTKPHSS